MDITNSESQNGGVATMPPTPETNGGGLLPEPPKVANPLSPIGSPDVKTLDATHQQMEVQKDAAAKEPPKRSIWSKINPFSAKTVIIPSEANPAPAATGVLEQAGQVAANAEATTGGALPADGAAAPAIENPSAIPEIPAVPPMETSAPTVAVNSSLPDHLAGGTTPDMPRVDDVAKAAVEGPDAPKFGGTEQLTTTPETAQPVMESVSPSPVIPTLDTTLGASTTEDRSQTSTATPEVSTESTPSVLEQAGQVAANAEATSGALPTDGLASSTLDEPTVAAPSEAVTSVDTTIGTPTTTEEASTPTVEASSAYKAPEGIPEYHPPVDVTPSPTFGNDNPQTPAAEAQAQWPKPDSLESAPAPAVPQFSTDSLTDKDTASQDSNLPLPLEVNATPLPGAEIKEEPVIGELPKSDVSTVTEVPAESESTAPSATTTPDITTPETVSPTNPDETAMPPIINEETSPITATSTAELSQVPSATAGNETLNPIATADVNAALVSSGADSLGNASDGTESVAPSVEPSTMTSTDETSTDGTSTPPATPLAA